MIDRTFYWLGVVIPLLLSLGFLYASRRGWRTWSLIILFVDLGAAFLIARLTGGLTILIEIAVVAPILLWVLLAPPNIRRHPARKAYLLGFALLASGLTILAIDQPWYSVAAADPQESSFGLWVNDPYLLARLDYDIPPTIEWHQGEGSWNGKITFSGSDLSGASKSSLSFFVILPHAVQSDPDLSSLGAGDCSLEDNYAHKLMTCKTDCEPDCYIDTPLVWSPQLQRFRIGEQRLSMRRVGPLRFSYLSDPYQDGQHPPPRLSIHTDPAISDVINPAPSPSFALRDMTQWELTARGTSAEPLELTLVNRQARQLADQGIQILILGAGLVLGLFGQVGTPQPTIAPIGNILGPDGRVLKEVEMRPNPIRRRTWMLFRRRL